MRNQNIDKGWEFGYGTWSPFAAREKAPRIVDLPHDYMIESDVMPDAPAGPAMGYYTGGVAYYRKLLFIPQDWENDCIGLKFDGVMMNATIEVNGCRVALQHYGYAPFFVDITPYVYCGQENSVTVTVNPSQQPNSRWYSGAGIYRSVELVHTPKLHIAEDGIFVYTKNIEYNPDGSAAYAFLQTEVEVRNEYSTNKLAKVEVYLTEDGDSEVVVLRSTTIQVEKGSSGTARVAVTVELPKLWSAEHPNLYQVHARVTNMGTFKTHAVLEEGGSVDETGTLFGIRTVTADAVFGLRINGQTTKLRGGCLHHDNGILGIVSVYEIEERKLKKLKQIGFNAIRTTHNPPSKALMEACSRLGVYVFDEAFDVWGMGKQPGDYNQYFDTDWQKDLSAFMRRDRNFPSVIIWSTGNEITERGGLNNGYVLANRIAEFARRMDPSRPISNGICSFWNGLDDELMAKEHRKMFAKFSEDANVQNMDVSGGEDRDWEYYTEPFANGLDIAGYNYLESRYETDHEMYPDRVILGSENYPREIGFQWPRVMRLPYVIGDFTWTAVDYIGEAGIGKAVWVEPDDPRTKMGPYALPGSQYPWRLANDADIDINGNILPQGEYRSVVWGNPETYVYSYDPADYHKVELVSMWGFTAVRKSWNWPGQEGQPAKVMVFSNADEVELFQNGRSIGRKSVAKDGELPQSVLFETVYEPGELLAVSYQEGRKVSQGTLKTAGEPNAVRLIPEHAGDFIYVGVELVDRDGAVVCDAGIPLEAKAEGGAVLAGFGSANPVTDENYTSGSFTSYRGRALAVLRATAEQGQAVLTVSAKGLESARITVEV